MVRPVSTSSNAKVARCGRPLPIIGILRFWDATRSFSLSSCMIYERERKRECIRYSRCCYDECKLLFECKFRMYMRACVCVCVCVWTLRLSLVFFRISLCEFFWSRMSTFRALLHRMPAGIILEHKEERREHPCILDRILRIESLISEGFTL